MQGNLIATYAYDEWGRLLSIETAEEDNAEQLEIAQTNPLRYRGYYYDNETGLYYLQSRYYNPELCRFISADDFDYISNDETLNLNAYAYCVNNPVNYSDPAGNSPISDRFENLTLKILDKFLLSIDNADESIVEFFSKIIGKFELSANKINARINDLKIKIQNIKSSFDTLFDKAKTAINDKNFSELSNIITLDNILACLFVNRTKFSTTMPMLFLSKNDDKEINPNPHVGEIIDIIMSLMIFDEISIEMTDIFGKDFTNNFFGFLGNFFLLIPSAAKAFIEIIKNIPKDIWKIIDEDVKEFSGAVALGEVVSKLAITYLGEIIKVSEASFGAMFAVWGAAVLPAELALLIPSILTNDSLSPTQKFTLIFVDSISIIISAAIDIAIAAFEPTGIIKFIGIAVSTLFPIAIDLIARILINKENTA